MIDDTVISLRVVSVAFRLQLSLDSAESDIANAKNDLLAGCSAAEKTATAAASLPRYTMVLATNQQFARAVNDSMGVANTALVNALTVMEIIAEPLDQLDWAEEGTREVYQTVQNTTSAIYVHQLD